MFLVFRLLICSVFAGAVYGANVQGSVDGSSFDVAVLIPVTGEWTVGQSIASAPIVAIEKISNDSILPYSVNWEWRDTKCEPLEGTKKLIELWDAATDLDAIIGGGCSAVCEPVALIAAAFNIPFVSFGCNDNSLSDSATYPTFVRTVGSWGSLATMADRLFERFGWTTRVGIVTGLEGIMTSTASIFKLAFEEPPIPGHTQKTVVYRSLDSSGMFTVRQMAAYMKDMVRVMVVLMHNSDLRAFLLACRDEGMMNGEYAYVTIDADLSVAHTETIRPQDVHTSYNGIINFHITKPSGTTWDTFTTEVVAGLGDAKITAQGHPTIGTSAPITEVDVHAGQLHDALLAWAYGVQAAHLANAADLDNGQVIRQEIINLASFAGISGQVDFDANGGRMPDYDISIVQDLLNTPIFQYCESTQLMTKVFKPSLPADFSGLKWKGDLSGPPSSAPICGWNQEYCPDKKIALKVSLGLLFSLIFLGALGYLIYRKWKWNKEVHDLTLWKISIMDMSDSRLHTQLMATRALLRARTTANLGLGNQVLNNVVTVGMRDMKHPNINPFVAAVCDHPHVAICMLYTEKGSLQDVLYNEDVSLTWDYKISIALDIIKGLNYLHYSSIGSHGNLTSNNCVIDSRWVCKLTDYGAAHFKKGHRASEINHDLWRAPEFLVNSDGKLKHTGPYGTRSGDVYSFGIILLEIITREVPYRAEIEEFTFRGVIQRISERHLPPFRPTLDGNTVESNSDWVNLMFICWEDDPAIRPIVKNVMQSLNDMNGKRTFNANENMLKLMEDHSQRLEELLNSRNEELTVEKKRVNNLLHSLLPMSVANKLMEGRAVKTKVYNKVSICYALVTNLESILERLPQDQFTNVLNLITQQFEAAAAGSNTFKMETTSGGALFVNGCPDPQEEGVESIIQMAAGLVMDSADTDPELSINLSVGVHTGSVVAGIVGLMVPRFCVFGESLRATIRLAETCEALTIHISEDVLREITQSSYNIKHGPGVIIGGINTKTFLLSDM